eukprot:909231-Pelagomonas_calceolata.AAC.1
MVGAAQKRNRSCPGHQAQQVPYWTRLIDDIASMLNACLCCVSQLSRKREVVCFALHWRMVCSRDILCDTELCSCLVMLINSSGVLTAVVKSLGAAVSAGDEVSFSNACCGILISDTDTFFTAVRHLSLHVELWEIMLHRSNSYARKEASASPVLTSCCIRSTLIHGQAQGLEQQLHKAARWSPF